MTPELQFELKFERIDSAEAFERVEAVDRAMEQIGKLGWETCAVALPIQFPDQATVDRAMESAAGIAVNTTIDSPNEKEATPPGMLDLVAPEPNPDHSLAPNAEQPSDANLDTELDANLDANLDLDSQSDDDLGDLLTLEPVSADAPFSLEDNTDAAAQASGDRLGADLAAGLRDELDLKQDPEKDPEQNPEADPELAIDPFQDLPPELQVRFKPADDHIDLLLPLEQENLNPEVTVELVDSDLWQQLQVRLRGSDRFWTPGTPVYLRAYNRLLDVRQLQEIADTLAQFDLKLQRVYTYRRQTAVAAATAGYSVEQYASPPKLLLKPLDLETQDSREPSQPEPPKVSLLAEPLYLQATMRSGAEIRHHGTVVILGDLNPGSSVIADGDIFVWGRLRGIAHAGAAGNRRCLIMALQLHPTQLRIADAVARVPDASGHQVYPEVAYIEGNSIRITAAGNFTRPTEEE